MAGRVALTADALGALPDGVPGPDYDRARLVPGVVHVGVGGFHRAHQAMYHDRLLRRGEAFEWGICGVGVRPEDRRMAEVLAAQDGLYTLVLKHPDGTYEPQVIGALTGFLLAPDDPEAVLERMAAAETRIVSLTITEGGYGIDDATGDFDLEAPAVAADLAEDAVPRTVFGLVTEALRRRRERGLGAFTVMSCDNLPGNGRLSQAVFTTFARAKDPDLAEWIEAHVRFPNSMVDRITPATTDEDRAMVRERFGLEDAWPVVCEPFAQWVLEDAFSAGRPPYEDAGVQVVDDVEPYELMKLRLLNASHQALGHLGALLGHRYVHEAAEDPALRAFVRGYMDEEAAPTLPEVPGVDVGEYQATLLERFSSPEVRDTLERLRQDSSDRIPKFVLPVIRDQLARGGLVDRAAAVVAAWARTAETMPVEDRQAERLAPLLERARETPAAFLADRQLFGPLGEDERFARAFASALEVLRERGPEALLA
jgi:mannitol 2-dehydrogenase